MICFKGHSDGKVIVPDEPVDLPKDQPLRVIVETEERDNKKGKPEGMSFLKLAREIAEKFEGTLREDLAENHDYYKRYGTKN